MPTDATTNQWLQAAQHQLEAAGITTARLDTLVLLEDCLQRDRALLLAHPETELTPTQQAQLDDWLQRRAAHEPLAYIRGHSEFYGREFYVDNHVLEPRPESETMIHQLLELVSSDPAAMEPTAAPRLIIDVGTGSGALAITAACELATKSPYKVLGVDIDPACLQVAARNAERQHVDVAFVAGDLLEPFLADREPARLPAEPIFALLCNLPYVPDSYPINRSAAHEPRLALFGGSDGLDPYRTLFQQARARTEPPRYILTESLPSQHDQLTQIAAAHSFVLMRSDDFIQVFTSRS